VVATGRSDFPNQVNNVLSFPSSSAVRSTRRDEHHEAMKLGRCARIADLATAEQSEIVAAAYGEQPLSFGPEYLIPKPFDPRLIVKIAPAVARAAMESGVATRPIADFEAYNNQLMQFVYHSGLIMKPIFSGRRRARAPDRALRRRGRAHAAGRAGGGRRGPREVDPDRRPAVIERRIERNGLRIKPGTDFDLVNPNPDPRYREYWTEYHRLAERSGVTQQSAQVEMRRRPTLIGAMMMHRGEATGLVCGASARTEIICRTSAGSSACASSVRDFYAMNALMLPKRTIFMCDTYVNLDPSAEQLAEMTALAAGAVRRFGVIPRAALLSHSNFGTSDAPSARKMRAALELIRSLAPDLAIEGEMHGDAALNAELRLANFRDHASRRGRTSSSCLRSTRPTSPSTC